MAGLFSFLGAKMVAIEPQNANVRPAGKPFDETAYTTIANVPIFAEHETTARDGRRLRFTKDELQAICNRCNQRIAETGDYAGICIGHTPEPGDARPSPPLIGVAGPFRLGLIGHPGQRRRYAILADFHIRRDKAHLLKDYPRRSPELWLEDRFEDMFLDPIALLGAEAPRLDMGLLLYTAARNGRLVERYAAAAPAPAAVFVPSQTRTKRYQPTKPSEGSTMALTPDDVRQIVEALEQLDWVQWVKSEMSGGEGQEEEGATPPDLTDVAAVPPEQPEGPPAPGDAPMPPPAADAGPPAPPPAEPPAPPAAPPAPGGPPPVPPADEDKEKMCGGMKPYSAEGSVVGDNPGKPSGSPSVDGAAKGAMKATEGDVDPADSAASTFQKASQYSKAAQLEAELAGLKVALADTQKQLNAERSARVGAERYQRLSAMRTYLAFDLDTEFADARELPEPQFERYCKSLERNCTKIPGGTLPTFRPEAAVAAATAPDRPGSGAVKEKYNRQLSDRARSYCERRAMRGEPVVYEEVLSRLHRGEPLPD